MVIVGSDLSGRFVKFNISLAQPMSLRDMMLTATTGVTQRRND
jgi:hypothetical protein